MLNVKYTPWLFRQMEDPEILEPLLNHEENSLINTKVELIQKKSIDPILRSKKFHRLEKKLITSFLDPKDSEYRRRYLRRWIYGEGLKAKGKKKIETID